VELDEAEKTLFHLAQKHFSEKGKAGMEEAQ